MNEERKYVCFCCGHEYESYQEYKDHILEVHEEGKDYIKCPLARCQCPVRDVRAHFKAIHKTEPMPKCGQMTAIVWRDFGARKSKKPRKFKEGFYESTKMHKKFKYRSSWEEQVYKCLDLWDDVMGFEAEPFKIPYLFEGSAHNYTPDIFVSYWDGKKEIWEVKPEGQKQLEKNKAKWYAAQEACKTRGWEFKVITEADIPKLQKKVKIQGLERLDEGSSTE